MTYPPADMDITIRQERPADHRETELVLREAFWNIYSPGCTEHWLMHLMRDSGDFVKELALLAVADDRIIGAVAALRSCILADSGQRHEVLTLGPIGVLPSFQRRGAGKMLIESFLKIASAEGFRAVLLCGDPAYYGERGFSPAEKFGIRNSDDRYFAGLMACPLYENALEDSSGRYLENQLYVVDEAGALAFDAGFPFKERIAGTPSQLRFRELLASMTPEEIVR